MWHYDIIFILLCDIFFTLLCDIFFTLCDLKNFKFGGVSQFWIQIDQKMSCGSLVSWEPE